MRYGAVIICQHHHIIIRRGPQLSFAVYLPPVLFLPGSFGWWWWYTMVCLVTARLICLQLKGGSPVFSSSVTTSHSTHVLAGWDKTAVTRRHWQLTIPPISRSKQWSIYRLRSVVIVRPLDCCNYNPEISAARALPQWSRWSQWQVGRYFFI